MCFIQEKISTETTKLKVQGHNSIYGKAYGKGFSMLDRHMNLVMTAFSSFFVIICLSAYKTIENLDRNSKTNGGMSYFYLWKGFPLLENLAR